MAVTDKSREHFFRQMTTFWVCLQLLMCFHVEPMVIQHCANILAQCQHLLGLVFEWIRTDVLGHESGV